MQLIRLFSSQLLSILTFALSSSSTWGSHGGGWVGFVSISGFFNATIWFILHLFNTVPPVFVNYFIVSLTVLLPAFTNTNLNNSIF